MEKLVARVGYAEHNYSAVLELPDEVIVVTHKNFERERIIKGFHRLGKEFSSVV